MNETVSMPKGPKRAQSSYMFFCAEKREELKEEEPDLKGSEIMKRLGSMWRDLDEEGKSKYETLALNDKTRYKNDLETFREENKVEIEAAETLQKEIQDQKNQLKIALRKKWDALSEKDRKKYFDRIVMDTKEEEDKEFDSDHPELPSKSRMFVEIKKYLKGC